MAEKFVTVRPERFNQFGSRAEPEAKAWTAAPDHAVAILNCYAFRNPVLAGAEARAPSSCSDREGLRQKLMDVELAELLKIGFRHASAHDDDQRRQGRRADAANKVNPAEARHIDVDQQGDPARWSCGWKSVRGLFAIGGVLHLVAKFF